MAEDQFAFWKARRDQWHRYLEEVLRSVDAGKDLPLGPSPAPLVAPEVSASTGAPAKVVFCAPHPDDESLGGALPLRLRLETGARVTNVAITMGRDVSQRARRFRELESACRVLGFDLVVPHHPAGFDDINLTSRRENPKVWSAKVETLREILDCEKPDVVFAPHADDFNTTHIGAHYLVTEALTAHLERSGRELVPLIETEFWHQLAEPNLMVGIAPDVVAIQLMAASEHGGEMARNPYHLRHACRLMDNVRRGSEVVGGQGVAAQPFPFAELYRVTVVNKRGTFIPQAGSRIVGPTEKIDVTELITRLWPQKAVTGDQRLRALR